MEFLTAIGTGVVGKIAEYTVEPVGRQVGYVFHYSRNLSQLQSQVTDLDAARESLERKIYLVEDERKGRKVETLVTNWLADANKITGEAKDFLKDEHQAKIKCLYGFCPNLMARHHLSRKSINLVQDVAELYGRRDFANIADAEEVDVLFTNDYVAYDSRTSVVQNVMDELRNSNTSMIGVYGIGGVGKTTLVKEIYKQAKKGERLFDEVVMVLDLKQNPSMERIQKEIAEKLGLNLHEIETRAGRARHICSRIKDKKTLVLLDDVWENIDLEAVGLPRMPTLKILLTSRSKIVLSRDMGTQKEFHLDVLDKKEAWILFQKIAGDIVKNPDIQTVATQVAEKCGGLPLLIVTVARALKKSPLHAWKDALRRLKRLDGQGLTERAYSTIEWSYSTLDTEELKSLFMLCGVVVGTTNTFSIVDLWKYSMGLGLLRNVDTVEEAWDALYSLLEQLKDSCLLLDDIDDNIRVRIHDLVKEFARGIASRDQHVLSLSYGSELKEWPADKEFREKCTMINIDRCNIPKLPHVLQCQELTFFRLISSNDDSYQEIPCNFFKEMKKLSVLDLTNLSIPSLPLSLQFLKSLQTLCLHHCTLEDIALVGQLLNLEILSFLNSKFTQLPKEIGLLIRLRLLDLTGCSQLQVISPNVLSSLKRLEHLRMGNSFNRWEVGRVVSTKISNANLEELKHLHKLTALQIHIPDANTIPADLFTSKLERFQICIGSAWKWDDVDEALNTLKLNLPASNELDQGLKLLFKRTEDLYLEGMEGVNNSIVYQLGTEGFQHLKHLHVQNSFAFEYINNGKVIFPNLSSLVVHRCNGLRFMLSYSMARSLIQLKHLEITECQMMEEIVSTKQYGEEITFPQLQHLKLKDLPSLARFCSGSYSELLSLKTLKVVECAKLKKFIFDPLSKRIAIYKEIEGGDLKENLQTVVQHFIFDVEKVVLPHLTSLIVHRLDGLSFLLSSSMARSIVQFRHREISEPQIMEEIVSARGHGEENLDDMFSTLELLEQNCLPSLAKFGGYIEFPYNQRWNIVECIKLETVFDPVSKSIAIYKEIKETHSEENLESVVNSFLFDEKSLQVVLRYITRLIIHRCHGLSFLLSSDMARTLVQLEHVEISECQIMKEIVFLEECSEANIDDMLPNLEQLVLNDLPNLTRFCSGSRIEFPSLERLHLEKCTKLETFIFYPLRKSIAIDKEIEERDTENLEKVVPYFLFDKKVWFPKLERLTIIDLPKLTKIWGSQLAENSFCKLREVIVQQCNSLINFVPDSITRDFHRLQKLTVENCGVEETVAQKEGEILMLDQFVLSNLTSLMVHQCDGLGFLLSSSMVRSLVQLKHLKISKCQMMEQIVLVSDGVGVLFSKLEQLELNDLPNLARFCSGTYIEFPSLEMLKIVKCTELQTFIVAGSLFNNKDMYNRDFLFDEKVSFPNLEKLIIDGLPNFRTIWHNQLPPDSFYRLKDVVVQECNSLINIFAPSVMGRLNGLSTLYVQGCESLQVIFELEDIEVKDSYVRISAATQLKSLYCQNLDSVYIYRCGNLTNIFPASVARDDRQLIQKITVDEHCGVLEEFVTKGEGRLRTLITKFVFPQLVGQALHASEWPLLETLVFSDQGQVEIFAAEYSSFQKILELGILIPIKDSFLLIKKVVLSNLTSLIVHQRDDLRFLLSSSMAKSLVQLKHLQVSKCKIMEEIILTRGYGVEHMDNMFSKLENLDLNNLPCLDRFCSGYNIRDINFPKVTSVTFRNLPRLTTFCLGMHASKWPLLETLELYECYQVEIFAAEFSSFQKLHQLGSLSIIKQPLFLIEKGSFAKLENLNLDAMHIWFGPPSPAEIFIKLKTIDFSSSPFSKRAVFLQMDSSGHGDGTFPHFKKLKLNGMEKLMLLWKENPQPAGPVFPNLEILLLEHCHRLENILRSSAISFQNLTTLEVTFCWRLRYLTSYSIAKSLVHLQKLKVDECKSMTEIVAIGDGDGDDEIVFSLLKHLELNDLISLQRFCSPNCRVKMPSLITLTVDYCPVKFKKSHDSYLLLEKEDASNFQPHDQAEVLPKAVDAAAASSSGTNQNQPAQDEDAEFEAREPRGEGFTTELNNDPALPDIPQSSEQGVEAVIQEPPLFSKNLEHAEVMDLKEPVVTKNLQEADLGLIEHLNLITNEDKRLQLQAGSRSQRIAQIDAVMRRLQELRDKEAEMRDQEKQLADG